MDTKTKPIEKEVVAWSAGRLGNILFSAIGGQYYANKIGANFAISYIDGFHEHLKEVRKTFLKDFTFVKSIKKSDYFVLEDDIKDFNFFTNKDKILLMGYRQNPNYWENDKDFVFSLIKPEKGIIQAIEDVYHDVDLDKLVCINVRRGDYTNGFILTKLGLLKNEWFEKCMKTYGPEQRFLIVSDDIEYCKSHFKGNAFIFADRKVDGYDKVGADLWIQTLCKDNIISNSTFSWWGAYLNQTKGRKVYCPKQFFRFIPEDQTMIPENDNWILIDSDFQEPGKRSDYVITRNLS